MFFPQNVQIIRNEQAAVLRLLQRSNVDVHLLLSRSFSTSAQYRQSNKESEDKKPDKDDNKMPSMLAKALLWMFTGYMLVTVITLMFPGGNQPEIVRYEALGTNRDFCFMKNMF